MANESAENMLTVRDDAPPSMRGVMQPYNVILGVDYKTYEEGLKKALTQVLMDDRNSTDEAQAEKDVQTEMNTDRNRDDSIVDTDGSYSSAKPYQFMAPSVSDASIGGNDVINPHAAFNEDDDIVHEVFTNGTNANYGMGRCYSEIYDSKQQILYITAGVPKYRNLNKYLADASDAAYQAMQEDGGPMAAFWEKIKELFDPKTYINLAFKIITLPIEWLADAAHYFIGGGAMEDEITDYFYFRETMPLFLRTVNTLMSHIAVGMGIYGEGSATLSGTSTDEEAMESGRNAGVTGMGSNITSTQKGQYGGVPAILEDGPDIFRILCRRAMRMGVNYAITSDSWLRDHGADINDESWRKKEEQGFVTGFKVGALEGANYIGFRIDRSDQANESFSNTTRDSEIAERLNGYVQTSRGIEIGEMSGGGMVLSKAKKTIERYGNIWQSLKSLDIGGAIEEYNIGNGFYDLPRQWASASGMSRNLTFNFKLRARTGGDNVSIYQSIMVPLSILLAATLPRGVGKSAFTSPFLIRAYCRGMFAVPVGIIQSLTITRGASEFGWTLNRLPTVVDVSVTIEDLSPMLFLTIAGMDSIVKAAFNQNTKMHEYLDTLTGLGLKERRFRFNKIKRRVTAAFLANRNTLFSPTYWGYTTGDSSLVRSIANMLPWHRVKNN